MKTRTNKQLLQILTEHGDIFKKYKSGLCWLTSLLCSFNTISRDESLKLRRYLKKNCKGLKEYYYGQGQIDPFYWPKGKWEPRLKWLNEQIKKLPK